ncbi:unnamed protein product [Brassica oleracea var. botrytis]
MASPVVYNGEKPHVVCVPYPAQGHINPMLKVAKLLYARGFHVTFVNTVYNHNRLIRSRGPHAVKGLPSFRFESIPDGLPETDVDVTQDITALCDSTMKNCLTPFKELLQRINAGDDVPPVSCIVADGCMSFTLDAAEELGVPEVLFWTTGASAFMIYLHFYLFIEKGLAPIKAEDYLTNEYLDNVIDFIPSMKNLKFKDIPSFIRTTNPDDIMLKFALRETERSKRASAIILNTFDDLDHDVIQSMNSILPPVYPVGPLHLLANREIEEGSELGNMGSNLWKEETGCLDWLDTKAPNSVVYVNFGSITVITAKQLAEFAWEGVFMGHPAGLSSWRRGNGSAGVFDGDGRPEDVGKLVSSGESSLPPGNRRFLDALWMELDVGESLWRCSNDMLAILCRPANEL